MFLFLLLPMLSLQAAELPPNDPFAKEVPLEEPAFDNSKFMGEFFYMLLMLGILISVVYFLAWFLRRMTTVRIDQLNESSAIKVLERRQLSQRTTLYLIEAEGKKIMLAETPTTAVQLGLHKE